MMSSKADGSPEITTPHVPVVPLQLCHGIGQDIEGGNYGRSCYQRRQKVLVEDPSLRRRQSLAPTRCRPSGRPPSPRRNASERSATEERTWIPAPGMRHQSAPAAHDLEPGEDPLHPRALSHTGIIHGRNRCNQRNRKRLDMAAVRGAKYPIDRECYCELRAPTRHDRKHELPCAHKSPQRPICLNQECVLASGTRHHGA